MVSKPMAILQRPCKIQLLASKRIREKMEELLSMLIANKEVIDDTYSKCIPIIQEALVKKNDCIKEEV